MINSLYVVVWTSSHIHTQCLHLHTSNQSSKHKEYIEGRRDHRWENKSHGGWKLPQGIWLINTTS